MEQRSGCDDAGRYATRTLTLIISVDKFEFTKGMEIKSVNYRFFSPDMQIDAILTGSFKNFKENIQWLLGIYTPSWERAPFRNSMKLVDENGLSQ
jgi:hypothetical protein